MNEKGAPPPAAPLFFAPQISVPRSVPRTSRGWSLIELAIVLAIAAVLIFFAVRNFQPLDSIAMQQAERLRNDIRNVQMLAVTWNQALRITTAAGSYSIGCVTAGAAPCNVTPVINPATGQAYSVNLESSLTLAGPGFTLDIDSLGRPKNGGAFTTTNATYTISGASTARTVTVEPLTGFPSAQ